MLHAVSSRLPGRRIALVAVLAAAALVAVLATVEPPPTSTAGGGSSRSDDLRSRTEAKFVGDERADGTADTSAMKSSPAEPIDDGEAGRSALPATAPVADESAAGGLGGGVAADIATPAPTVAGGELPTVDIKVIRTGSLGLKVKRGTFDDAYAEAQQAATAMGGFVVTASRSGTGEAARFGTLTIRIPSARFDDAMEELRGIDGAKVERLDVSSQDVTQEYVDTGSRLKHDRAIEARLLALVAKAADVDDVLAVQARLDQVQEQIELSKGRLVYLDRMTSMTTIDIAIREPGARAAKAEAERKAAKDDGRPWGVRESFSDAAHRFVGNVNRFIVWLGGALPALLVIGVASLAVRARWRRRSSTAAGDDA